MSRRQLDFYATPAWATEILLSRLPPFLGYVLEPCVGNGHIANAIVRSNKADRVHTNDLDEKWPAGAHLDATQDDLWTYWPLGLDWVISNPPFDVALPILRRSLDKAMSGVAMLLRISFLEPTKDRGLFLEEHPPSSLIVLPRISFTGDGKSDNVTCIWCVWEQNPTMLPLEIVPKRAPQPRIGELTL